ncbi:MAG: type I methionyl aminopeptidase [Planctomycetaceae bacterium]
MSLITLKSRREIGLMRAAGHVVAGAHAVAREMLVPGVTTQEIDSAVEEFFRKEKVTSLFKGFPGKVPYPAVTCISINEQIVHGIPGGRRLEEGDIVSLDTACRKDRWCGDSAWTYAIGEVSPEKQKLMEIGEQSLALTIEALKTEKRWSDVAQRMMDLVKQAGFSLVDQFVGHGIGQEMHEPPQVPNFFSNKTRADDFEIQPGLVLAIEPMINAGTKNVRILADHWTAVTTDGRPSVHFEHTVAITSNGPEILTAGVGDPNFTYSA